MKERQPSFRPSQLSGELMHAVGIDNKPTASELEQNLAERRAALSEGTKLPEATAEQTFYSQALFAIRLGERINDEAELRHNSHPHLPVPKKLSKEIKQTRNAMTTLYVLQASDLPLNKWERKWKEKAYDYKKWLDSLKEDIEKTRAKTIDNASLITDQEIEEIKTLAKPKKYSSNYRKTLVTETEPDVDKRKREIRNVGISGALAIPTAVAGHVISGLIAAGAVTQSVVEFGAIYHDWTAALVALGVTGVSALSYYANYKAQLHLLDEVGISPGIGAKFADYATKRLSPGNEKLRKKRIFLTTIGPTAAIHPIMLVGLLFGGSLPYIGYQLGTAAVNFLEAGGSEGATLGALMIRRRKEQIRRAQQPPERPTSEETHQSPS